MRTRDLSHWLFMFLILKVGSLRTTRQLLCSMMVPLQDPSPVPAPGVPDGRATYLLYLSSYLQM